MHCRSCGAEIPADSRFCSNCGKEVAERGTADPVEPAVTPAERLRQLPNAISDGASEDEQDLWKGGFSGKAMVGSWAMAGLLTLVLVVLLVVTGQIVNPLGWAAFALAMIFAWGGLACLLGYRKMAVHYELTTQRFIHRTGILRRTTDRIEVIDIDDVAYVQGFVQRMFGVGTIKISSSDRTHPELALIGIEDVARIADMIDDVRRKERHRRGLHIEAI